LLTKRGDTVAASAFGEPPALLTTTSSRPNRSTAAFTSAAAWSGSRTSARTNTAVRPPAAGTCSGSVRPQTTTDAPSASIRDAMTAPMPLVPPVTMTALPSSRVIRAAR
jgi:hypothetical protein